MTSNQNDLTARMQRRLETERLKTEETAARELRRLPREGDGLKTH